ncbi:hypothetical protein PsorP6_002597 [Peronosclerospora sorghi]|uniref:Uncharacterized protein n=1 Tax=Peronosclerospora sorghi TaxID=230839 RepID=A0ACC0WV29_9STRA|nr:hypothetical protein PsorP6_002597 [Peronosclerospora sorghi]
MSLMNLGVVKGDSGSSGLGLDTILLTDAPSLIEALHQVSVAYGVESLVNVAEHVQHLCWCIGVALDNKGRKRKWSDGVFYCLQVNQKIIVLCWKESNWKGGVSPVLEDQHLHSRPYSQQTSESFLFTVPANVSFL